MCVIESGSNPLHRLQTKKDKMKEITFEDKVYKKLIELEPATEYDLLKKVSESVRGHFIQTVKDFIRYDYGKAWGFYIEFNDSYTNIIKKEY